MSIKIKEIPEQFKNADESTKNQLRNLAIDEAFKQAVSEEQLVTMAYLTARDKVELENKLKELSKQINLSFANLNLSLADLEQKVSEPKSSLEISSTNKASVDENKPKEKSLISEIINTIKNYKK